jgi:hypothetical protein
VTAIEELVSDLEQRLRRLTGSAKREASGASDDIGEFVSDALDHIKSRVRESAAGLSQSVTDEARRFSGDAYRKAAGIGFLAGSRREAMWLERIAGLAFDHWSDAAPCRAYHGDCRMHLCPGLAVYRSGSFGTRGSVWSRRCAPDCRRNIRICMPGWLSAVLAMRNRPSRVAAPATLANQREMQLIMLVEAVMLGYTLARRAHRSTS